MSFVLQRVLDVSFCLFNQFGCLHHDKEHSLRAFHRQYRVCGEIGSGGFGRVYKAYRLADGLPVAVKSIRHKRVNGWTLAERRMIPTEICFMEDCQDVQGVVRLVGWFSSRRGFLIVMERPANFMDLFDLISTFGWLEERMARGLFSQIVDTVIELYRRHSVIHRDIKDENVVIDLDSGTAWLVDFGAAELLERAKKQRFQGTMSYSPPEVFQRDRFYPLEGTVWSLGILLYLLVVGKPPFRNELQICTGQLRFPRSVSFECRALVRRCLCPTPEGRISLEELQQNEWLQRHNAKDPFFSEFESQWRRRRRKRQHGALQSNDSLHAMSDGENDDDDDDDEDCSYRTEAGTAPGPLTIPPTVFVTCVAAHHSTNSSFVPHSSSSHSPMKEENAVLGDYNEQQNAMHGLVSADTRSSASSSFSLAMSDIGFETAPEEYDEWKYNNHLSSNDDICNGNDDAFCQQNCTLDLQNNAIPDQQNLTLDHQNANQSQQNVSSTNSMPLFTHSHAVLRCWTQSDWGSACSSPSSFDREARCNSFTSEDSFNSASTYFSASSHENSLLHLTSASFIATNCIITYESNSNTEKEMSNNDEDDERTLRTELPGKIVEEESRRGEMSEEDEEWDETIRENIDNEEKWQSKKNNGTREEPFEGNEQLEVYYELAEDDQQLLAESDLVEKEGLVEKDNKQLLVANMPIPPDGIIMALSFADGIGVGGRKNSRGCSPLRRRGGNRYRRKGADESAGRRKRRLTSPPQQS